MHVFDGSWYALALVHWRRLLTVGLELSVWIALFTGIAAIGQSMKKLKAELRVHTAQFDPDIGGSHSPSCNAFWDDYASNSSGLKTMLNEHFDVSWVYHDPEEIDPSRLPMFEASHSYHFVHGYSTPQELVQGLGLAIDED